MFSNFFGLPLTCIIFVLFSPLADAEIIDFELIELNGYENKIAAFRNHNFIFNGYELFVWEGFIFDDSFYANESSEFNEGNTLHPSKSASVGESNKALVTQRFTIKRTDGQSFYFCRANAAEKKITQNSEFLKVSAEYNNLEREQNNIFLDYQKGYEQIRYDFGRAIKTLEFAVSDENRSVNQIIFDDIKLETYTANCDK